MRSKATSVFARRRKIITNGVRKFRTDIVEE